MVERASETESEVTYSLTYVASPLQPREDQFEWCAKMAANLSVFIKIINKTRFSSNRKHFSENFLFFDVDFQTRKKNFMVWAI